MPTIKDVARLAGVSISTVSEILNGKLAGTPATREKIEAAARQLNYVPNVHARKLLTRRSENLAFFFSRLENFGSHLLSNPFYASVLEGVDRALDKNQFNLIFETIEEKQGGRVALPRVLKEDNVDGLLLAGQFAPEFLEQIRRRQTPAVLIDNCHEGLNSVVTDNLAGARLAVRYLHELGHRRVAFIGGQHDRPSYRERLAGYRAAVKELRLAQDRRLVTFAEFPDGAKAAAELPAGANRPTAIFAANDAIAIEAMRFYLARGVRIPEDLSIIGFDDLYFAASLIPPLTTVRVRKLEMGGRALERLLKLIALGGGSVPERIVLPPELAARATCAPPRR